MKTYIKKLLFRILYGSVIGLAVGHTSYFIYALSGNAITLEPRLVIINYLGALLVGIWCCGISIIFDIEEWSLLRQTITHSILLAPYLPFAFYIGWVPPTICGKIYFVLVYFIIYLIIWFSFKLYWTKKAKELNEELERLSK